FFNMSGGTINLVQVNTTTGTPVDWNQQGTVNYSGGTLHFGTGATAVNFFFRAQGNMPGMVIDTTTNDKGLALTGNVWCYGNVTIPAGAGLYAGDPGLPSSAIFNMLGTTFTNNGTFVGGLTSAGITAGRLQFAGATAPTYNGGSQANIILAYAQASNAITTGVEVPSGRTAESIQVFNTNGVTIAGGAITVTGNGGAAPDAPGLFLGGTTAAVAGGPLNT